MAEADVGGVHEAAQVGDGLLAVHHGRDVAAHALEHGRGHDADGVAVFGKQQAWTATVPLPAMR